MKKFLPLLYLFLTSAALPVTATAASPDNLFTQLKNVFSSYHANSNQNQKKAANRFTPLHKHKADSVFEVVNKAYTQGRISADSVVNVALYHKNWNPQAAELCLKPVAAQGNKRAVTELGALYLFTPEYARNQADGLKLLQIASNAGYNDANAYLGLYYYNKGDNKKAKTYFDACNPMNFGFGYAGLGGMYITGKGVKKDLSKAREYYRLSALKGYDRGMSLYGHNLLTTKAGPANLPDAFFWMYIAGEMGDDTSRVSLHRQRTGQDFGDSEVGQDANMALNWIETVNTGKRIQDEPVYKEGFLTGLKAREQAAEKGDDWSRFYLGSMNYNGDFLNQNYTQALKYYEPIAANGKLPRPMLALVNYRLAKMYREGLGVKKNPDKANRFIHQAAAYGSLPAYKLAEKIHE